MPFGGALSLGIGAGSSLLSGIFGGKGASKAAQIQAANAQKVAGMATDAANSGIAGVKGATDSAVSGVTGATNNGTADIANATRAGLQSIAAGTSGATGTLTDAQKQILSLYQPYLNQGGTALTSLQQLASPTGPLSQQFSFNPTDLQNDPGYQFTLQQGQQALQRSAAAQGNLFSGGTLKSLANYTTGTANQYFNDAYNRAANTFNINRQGVLSQIGTLQGLAGLGSSATSGAASGVGGLSGQLANTLFQGGTTGAQFGLSGTGLGANLGLQGATTAGGLGLQGATTAGQFGLTGAQIAGNALTGGANAQSAGTVGATNSWLNALNNGTNATLQYLAMKQPSSVTSTIPDLNPSGTLPGYFG